MFKALSGLAKASLFGVLFVAGGSLAAHAAATLDTFTGMEGTISIAGGTAHIPVMNTAAKNIMTHNPKIQITVAGGGSGVGVKQVGEGLADIGNTGRPLKEDEVSRYGLHTFPFAIDGVAVVVHAENPVSGLKTEQVQAIYSGAVTNWKELGGADAPISIYTREDGSGTREVFVERAINKGEILQTAAIVSSNGAMKVAVGKDANAIGYVGIGHVDNSVKALDINSIAATQEKAANGEYPVTRKLFMNTKGEPTPLVRAFIDYILTSADGEEAIVKAGYIPLAK